MRETRSALHNKACDFSRGLFTYILSMASLFRLRGSEPALDRPFRAPGYPVVPAVALALALMCLVAMARFNPIIGSLFVALMAAGYVYFQLTAHQRAAAPADAMLERV